MRPYDLRLRSGVLWFLIGLYFGISLLFAGIWLQGCQSCLLNRYSTVFLMLPFLGCLLGLIRLRKSGRPLNDPAHSVPTILLCAGLFLWTLGAMAWMYYSFVLAQAIPYPSLADAGYFSASISWAAAVIIVAKAVSKNLHTEMTWLWQLFIPLAAATAAVVLFARGGDLHPTTNVRQLVKFALDVGYPVVDAFACTWLFAFLMGPALERVGCAMRRALWVVFFGLAVNYLADLAFSISTTLAFTHPGNPLAYFNGSLIDWVSATALLLLSLGVLLIPLDRRCECMLQSGKQTEARPADPDRDHRTESTRPAVYPRRHAIRIPTSRPKAVQGALLARSERQ